jgi:ABC-2 type transport system ATP-binding protein
VRELIRDMAADKVIVLSTHILEEVEAVCSRAVIIADGRLLFDGTPEALMSRSELHNAVTVNVEVVDIDQARDAIAALSGVASVNILDTQGQRATLQVLAAAGAELAAPVSTLSRDSGWHVHALTVERGRLDDVFRDITRTGGPDRG